VTVRILADRDPQLPSGPQSGAFVFLSGPPAIDEPEPDIVVMPVLDFLALACPSGRTDYIAYGPVDRMEGAFDRGCLDYIREPWSMAELRARLGKTLILRFKAGDASFRLSGTRLQSDTATIELDPSQSNLLRLLLQRAPLPLSREAAMEALSSGKKQEIQDLSRCVAGLRLKLDSAYMGLGTRLRTLRRVGYRFDAAICG
jgi:hypothetical protein